jgi:cell division protease FtsH
MEMNDKAMKILLQEIDSLKEENGVLVVATCNDIRSLGPALVRSGRFDRIFEIGLPSLDDRKKILTHYFDKITMEKSLDVDYVARVTSGYSGAQLECLVNESGILAIERGQTSIDFDCFQTAMNRLAFHGIEGEIKDNEKHLVAVHEAGHAIVALYLQPNKLATASIIPQGQSKGHTRMMFEEEMYSSKNNDGLDDVAVALGGRVAEIIEFGESSSGCSDDLRNALRILDFIITESGKFGYEYLQCNTVRGGVTSEEQCQKIVAKRVEILNETHEKVKNIILEHKGVFDKIVSALETKHLLSRDELLKMVA